MTNLSTYRQYSLLYSYKRVRITEVNTQKAYLEGVDETNQVFRMTMIFYEPYLQLPKVGEFWLITKMDNNWYLLGRFEEGDQLHPVTEMNPGDARIEAPENLIIDAKKEIIFDFNKAKPSLLELDEQTIDAKVLYGSATLDQLTVGSIIIDNEESTTTDNSIYNKIFLEVYS